MWTELHLFLLSSSRNQSFHLQVLERKSLGCFQPEDSVEYLLVNEGGKVPCPGLNCSDNTDVIWYKIKRKVVWKQAGPLLKELQPVKAEVMCLPSRVSKLCLSSTGSPTSAAAGCTSARSASWTPVCISVTDKPQTTGSSGELLMSLL